MHSRFWFERGFVLLVFAWMAAAVDGSRAELLYVFCVTVATIVGAVLLSRHEGEE